MKPTTLLSTIVALTAAFAVAAPASDSINDISPANPLEKRSFTSCSNGVAVDCDDSTISCSGEDCTACCGDCCKAVQAPENSSCNSATPITKVKCGKKHHKGKKHPKKGKKHHKDHKTTTRDEGFFPTLVPLPFPLN